MARPPFRALSAAVLLGRGRGGDPATRPLQVLVADAEPSRRQRLSAALAEDGGVAHGARSWGEAEGVLMRTPLDAALLALDLPQAGGLAVGGVLRRWPAPVSALPLLALHASPTRVQEAAWQGAGFDALLLWPQDLDGLAARLRSVVVALTPPDPLDRALRAALREEIGAEALAARDRAGLEEAAALMARLRTEGDATARLALAETLAAVCDGLGAPVAAAAARRLLDASAAPPRDALMNALAAAGVAIRMEGRMAGNPRGPQDAPGA